MKRMPRAANTSLPSYPQDRLPFVEGLRGVAALYVVLTHFRSMVDPSILTGKPSTAPEWVQIVLAPFGYGHLAVAAFIVLSGFCLQVSLFNGKNGRIRDLGAFFRRRAWRILPPYYACLGLSILVALYVTSNQSGMPFTQYVPVTWEGVISHLFLVHNFDPDQMYKINGVLWSIAIEVQIYLLFPILVAIQFRFGRLAMIGVTSVLAVGTLLLFPTAMKLYPWFLPLFGFGMVAAYWAYRPSLRAGTMPALGGILAVVGMIATCWMSANNLPIPWCDVAVGIAVAALVYSGAVRPWSKLTAPFAWKPLVALGMFSYSLYLMHHPIQQILYVYRPAFVQGAAMELGYLVLVGLPVILALCFGFSVLFERPFLFHREAIAPVLREGLGTPLSLPLRSAVPPAEPVTYLERPKPRFAVVEGALGRASAEPSVS